MSTPRISSTYMPSTTTTASTEESTSTGEVMFHKDVKQEEEEEDEKLSVEEVLNQQQQQQQQPEQQHQQHHGQGHDSLLFLQDTCTDLSEDEHEHDHDQQHEEKKVSFAVMEEDSDDEPLAPYAGRSLSNRPMPSPLMDSHPIGCGNGTGLDEDDLEDYLAKEITMLSVRERDSVYDDLHGVAVMVEETADLVETKLDQLFEHLEQMAQTPSSPRAFLMAWSQPTASRYLQTPEFQLMFLRASCYNVQDAATRLCHFLEEKLELFGPSKLTRDITLNDLSPEDMQVLEQGPLQLMPLKDRAGRPIVFSNPSLLAFDDIYNYLRPMFYIFMNMIQNDNDAQRKGYVELVHLIDMDPSKGSPPPQDRSIQLRSHLPIRLAASHVSFCQTELKPWIRSTLTTSSKRDRVRVRLHHVGSIFESRFALMGFGVPTYAIPIHRFGGSNLEQHKKWIQRQKEIDGDRRSPSPPALPSPPHYASMGFATAAAASAATSVASYPLAQQQQQQPQYSNLKKPPSPSAVLSASSAVAAAVATRPARPPAAPKPPRKSLPSSFNFAPKSEDVLLGRGIPVMNHPGNLYYRQLVATNADRYELGNKFEKTVMAEMVLKRIKEAGGRFLKPRATKGNAKDSSKSTSNNNTTTTDKDVASGQWEEIDDQAARLKIASAFRFVRKQKKNKQQQQQQSP